MRRFVPYLALLVIHLALWPSPGSVQAQTEPTPVHLEWTVSETPTGGWTVGDHIPLRLEATFPVTLQVTLPELPQIWGPFEVLDQTLSEPTETKNGTFTLFREATVTFWAPGDYAAPPFFVRYRDADGTLYEEETPPLSIKVISVLEADDTEKRDLKPQASLPRPPIWPWILGTLLLAAAVGITGWMLLKRLRRRTVSLSAPAVYIDPRPPHEIAYGELDRIAALRLPTKGELKHHYTLVTDCLRTYVQGRYHIPALDQTTDELIKSFRQVRVDRGHVSLFRALLDEADLVKFAKLIPPIDQASAAIDQARHIIDVTKIADSEMQFSDIQDSVTRESDAPNHTTPND